MRTTILHEFIDILILSIPSVIQTNTPKISAHKASYKSSLLVTAFRCVFTKA